MYYSSSETGVVVALDAAIADDVAAITCDSFETSEIVSIDATAM